ncbi:MAG TPA: CHASE sensor domain-containing protein, partial [Flavitalea sp.]|nr:CHASE sensor domain-containing protein [Flavitalea sp.]
MLFKNLPIRKKLLRIVFLINGIVLLTAGMAFFGNEFYSFKKTTVEKLSTIGKIIAANSTAALAFDSPDDAREILAALRAEPHIVAACIYDKNGKIFSEYYAGNEKSKFPPSPGPQGYRFSYTHLDGFVPVMQETLPLGTLYLKS